ncbi:MAG: hypothetical protein WC875_00695, partial [Candidatus Absconditabacterales bacterium]
EGVGIGSDNPLVLLTVEGGIKPITIPWGYDPCASEPADYPTGTQFYYDAGGGDGWYCFCRGGSAYKMDMHSAYCST